MEQKNISLQVVFIASIILLGIELLTAQIIFSLRVHPLAAIGLARAAETAAMVVILRYGASGFKSIGLTGNELLPGFRKGLAWSAGFGICVLLFLAVLHILGYNFSNLLHSPAEKSAVSIFLLLFVGGLISPLAEEMFFRGMIFGYLRRRGLVTAILGSTVLFSLAHLLTTGITFVQIIGGLVFAVAYEVEKNLLVPITIHVLGNTAIFTISIPLAP